MVMDIQMASAIFTSREWEMLKIQDAFSKFKVLIATLVCVVISVGDARDFLFGLSMVFVESIIKTIRLG